MTAATVFPKYCWSSHKVTKTGDQKNTVLAVTGWDNTAVI